MKKQVAYFTADLETTVDINDCHVWSVANTALFDNDNFVDIDDNLCSFMDGLKNKLNFKPIIYFHNLKFDGSFVLDYLLNNGYKYSNSKKLQKNEFTCSITAMGQWYSLSFHNGVNVVEIRDSLKLLPFSVKAIGKGFNTKHQKLEMDYNKKSMKDCTKEDIDYIKNDVLVMKEALEIMLKEGHDKLTIGSCCMEEFKKLTPEWDYCCYDLASIKLGEDFDADMYIRKGYRGGYCYVHRKGKFKNGVTLDVNSLYPSVMHSKSGNRYPVGKPVFWKGDIPNEATFNNRTFVVRIKTRFRLKENHIPTLQLKGYGIYPNNKYLTTSDVLYEGKYYSSYMSNEGEVQAIPTITLTQPDYELFLKHYEVSDFEILDGCYFLTDIGIFDKYIDKWYAVKETSTGARRQIAKLFLNNLYGKLATSRDSSFKAPFLENGIVKFKIVHENNKKLVHIGMGAFVTAYARRFTIECAQKNYEHFCYADTDSLHLDCTIDEVIGCDIHPTALLKWKHESSWTEAIFTRQKTYGELIDGKWDLKACGMPPRAKDLFLTSIDGKERVKDLSEVETKWLLENHHSINDFNTGLSVPGKLVPKRVKGGIVLVDGFFTMHKQKEG